MSRCLMESRAPLQCTFAPVYGCDSVFSGCLDAGAAAFCNGLVTRDDACMSGLLCCLRGTSKANPPIIHYFIMMKSHQGDTGRNYFRAYPHRINPRDISYHDLISSVKSFYRQSCAALRGGHEFSKRKDPKHTGLAGKDATSMGTHRKDTSIHCKYPAHTASRILRTVYTGIRTSVYLVRRAIYEEANQLRQSRNGIFFCVFIVRFFARTLPFGAEQGGTSVFGQRIYAICLSIVHLLHTCFVRD